MTLNPILQDFLLKRGMLGKQPNRLDSPDLRGAEKAMARVVDIVKAREQAAATTGAVGARTVDRQLTAANPEEPRTIPDGAKPKKAAYSVERES